VFIAPLFYIFESVLFQFDMEADKATTPANGVNIRKVFHDKNARLAAMLPGFLYSYLERVTHQDGINRFLAVQGHKYGHEFAKAIISEFKVTVEVKGFENLADDKKYIFASNHPLGGFDGVLLLDILNNRYSEARILSNDILMNIKNLIPLFIPINKHGKQATESADMLHQSYLSDMQIITFPAGLVSRKIHGRVMDLEWKKNFISKAVQYQRDIVPVHCTGRNSNFFYNLANLRKKLGIKANIEMLYLVDETFKHTGEHVVVTFGKPIPYTIFDRSRNPAQWAKYVKEQAYGLAGITDVPV
jgi:putative hemolysin